MPAIASCCCLPRSAILYAMRSSPASHLAWCVCMRSTKTANCRARSSIDGCPFNPQPMSEQGGIPTGVPLRFRRALPCAVGRPVPQADLELPIPRRRQNSLLQEPRLPSGGWQCLPQFAGGTGSVRGTWRRNLRRRVAPVYAGMPRPEEGKLATSFVREIGRLASKHAPPPTRGRQTASPPWRRAIPRTRLSPSPAPLSSFVYSIGRGPAAERPSTRR